jgi:hypothetical protein
MCQEVNRYVYKQELHVFGRNHKLNGASGASAWQVRASVMLLLLIADN